MPGSGEFPFTAIYGGFSFGCVGYVRRSDGGVRALSIARDVPRSSPRTIYTSFGEKVAGEEYTKAYDFLRERLGLITDLLEAGLSWRALLTMPRHGNLYGQIVHAAEDRRIASLGLTRVHTVRRQESSK